MAGCLAMDLGAENRQATEEGVIVCAKTLTIEKKLFYIDLKKVNHHY
jgi:hypothetical protein